MTTLPDGLPDQVTWVEIYRAIAVLSSRSRDDLRVEVTEAAPSDLGPGRALITVDVDLQGLMRTVADLHLRYGPPPGRRILELTPEGRLQEHWRRATASRRQQRRLL